MEQAAAGFLLAGDMADPKPARRTDVLAPKTNKARRSALQKEIRAMEERIAVLETEQAALVEQLERGDKIDYAVVNRRLADIQQELPRLMDTWEKAALALDSN
jgi:predicted  nucleic acid-binding Zn-ribbon protein